MTHLKAPSIPVWFLRLSCVVAVIQCCLLTALRAQVPQLVNYQGRVAVGGVNFSGSGAFEFALVDTTGANSYWSNDGTSTSGSQPTTPVTLTVTNGLYSVLLGDTTLTNMTAIPVSVWTNPDVRLRVWFNDGTHGFQLLTPDQRLAPNGYLPDGAVTSAKIASGAVTNTQLAGNAVQAGNIAAGAVGAAQLAAGATAAPIVVSGTTQTAATNSAYSATSGNNVFFTLPAAANVGDTVQINGAGAGGWSVGGVAGAWTAQTGAPSSAWISVASSADGTQLAAVANPNGHLYTSSNAGVTWTIAAGTPTANWSSVASSSDGTHLVALVQDGQIYTSTNSGATWTLQSGAPSASWQVVASSADGTHLVAVTFPGQIYTSTNSGVNWTLQSNSPSANWGCVASSADGTHLVAGISSGRIYTSPDSGVTWTAQTGAPSTLWNSVASSSDGTHLAAAADGGAIYTSTDSGVTWTAQTNGAPGNDTWQSVASSADGTHLVAAADYDQIYVSTNSGASWTAQSGVPSGLQWSGVASSSDGTRLVAVAQSGQIYTSGLSGAQGTAITLQYLGNGQWTPVAQTQVAVGGITAANLAAGATLANSATSANIPNTIVKRDGGGNFSAGTVTATAFSGSGASLTNLPIPSAANFFFGYSTLAQTIASTNTFQLVTMNTTGQASNWVNNNGSLTVPATGLYLVHYNGQISTTTLNAVFSFRAVANGSEISGSGAAVTQTATGTVAQVSQSFIASLSAGNTLLFQCASSAAGGSLSTAGSTSIKPTFTCTIIRIQ